MNTFRKFHCIINQVAFEWIIEFENALESMLLKPLIASIKTVAGTFSVKSRNYYNNRDQKTQKFLN